MTNLSRCRAILSGFPGAPGVATMYFLDTATYMDSAVTLWTSLANTMPTDVTIQIENSGDVINDATGVLVDTWHEPAVDAIHATLSGTYAAPTGYLIGWETDQILDGRRLRGKTYVVPAGSSMFSANGSLNDATIVGYVEAAQAFITAQSSSFVVWHRPFAGSPAVGTRPARPAHAGGHGLVTACRIPDEAVVLRSRRD